MKILVIRFKLLGDSILASAICNSLKRSFPDSEVHYVTYSPYGGLFKNHRSIDKVYEIDEATRMFPHRYIAFVLRILREKYDVVIDAQATSKSSLFLLLSRNSEFKICANRRRFIIGATHKVSKPEFVDKITERLNLLAPLEAKYQITRDRNFALFPTDQELRTTKLTLQSMGIDLDRPLFLFATSANERYKIWCRTESKKLVEYCRVRYQAQILLFHGLEKERTDIKLLFNELGCSHDTFYDFPIRTLRCLPSLFSCCDLFIGNEGGPRHIAQAVGLPSVAIFSPSASKQEWLPDSDGNHLGIEWRDVIGQRFDESLEFEVGDSEYFRRYNAIKASMVIPLVDQLASKIDMRSSSGLVRVKL